MRFVMKLSAIVLLTFGVQVGYEVVRSVMMNSDEVYGMDTSHVDAVIRTDRQMNGCNPFTRQVVACVLTIPLPGEAE